MIKRFWSAFGSSAMDPPLSDHDGEEDEAPDEIAFGEGKQLSMEQRNNERSAVRKVKKRKKYSRSETTVVGTEHRVETDEDDSIVQGSVEQEVGRCSNEDPIPDIELIPPKEKKKRTVKKFILEDRTIEVMPISKICETNQKLRLTSDCIHFKSQIMKNVRRRPSNVIWAKLKSRQRK